MPVPVPVPFFSIIVLSTFFMTGSLYGRPESLLSFAYLQAKSSTIVFGLLIKYQSINLAGGVVYDRYYLQSPRSLKGGELQSPIDVDAFDPHKFPAGYTYVPAKPAYVLLMIYKNNAGYFEYTGNAESQAQVKFTLEDSTSSFSNFTSLVKYLLSSPLPENNKAGLALSRDIDDAQIKERQTYFLNHGDGSEMYLAKADLTKSADLPSYLTMDVNKRDIIEGVLKVWQSKWNATDVNGLMAMLDRGSAPYVGERSDEVLVGKFKENLKRGPIKAIQILRMVPTETGAVLYLLYDFSGKVVQGNIDIAIQKDGKAMIENLTFEDEK